MLFTIETEGFSLIYNKRRWSITGAEPITQRLVWLMNQIQELEHEYKKRDIQANVSKGK